MNRLVRQNYNSSLTYEGKCFVITRYVKVFVDAPVHRAMIRSAQAAVGKMLAYGHNFRGDGPKSHYVTHAAPEGS